jgi:hypothetical protein
MNEVSYRLTLKDVKAAQRRHVLTSPLLWMFRLAVVGVFAFMIIYRFSGIRAPIELKVNVGLIVLGVAIVSGLIFRFIVGRIVFALTRKKVEKEETGLHIAVINPEFVSERGPDRVVATPWKDVERVDSNSRYIWIFAKAQSVYIIPRSAFPAPEDAKAFLGTAKLYHEAARRGVPASTMRMAA